MRKFSGFIVIFLIGTALLSLVHIVADSTFAALREKTYDFYQWVSPISVDSGQVAVVAIDEASLAAHGRWPWPRELVGKLTLGVANSGAAAVGLDLFFSEADRGAGGAESDAAFADALSRAPAVLAMSLDPAGGPLTVGQKAGWTAVGFDPAAAATVTGGIAPLDLLANAASGLGIVRTIPDSDGVIRKVPMVWAEMTDDGQARLWPAFSMEILRVAQDAPSYTLRLEGLPSDAVRVGAATLPLGEDGRIRFIDTDVPVAHVSAARLLDQGTVPELAGRVVVLAVDVAGVDQYHLTARGRHRLGADVHAILLSQMLQGQYLLEAENARWIERTQFAGGAVLLLAVLTVFARRPILAGALSVPIIALPLATGAASFLLRTELIDGVQPTGGLLVLGATGGYMLYREAERRRGLLQKQFSQFLSPEVVRRLAESDAAAALKVEDREITALLVDLRGFTAMSRTLGAEKTVKVVNHFLEIANREIFARNGTVDKYMGDAVLAFWNAPMEVPDHADRAIDCARAVLAAVQAANPQLEAQGLPAIESVAAVETGICSVGNMGTEQRIDYTAIGGAINMTSRLEGETKKMGETMLVGPGAAARATRPLRAISEVEIRGVEGPVMVYGLPA
ncbi:CHASE2 domain-containing protein [Oricola sp.]|uniref:CHASE2 domain-containing protein n=1 Tax=Oricola sp. TaxID=1979950 RepID=UPI003BAC9925